MKLTLDEARSLGFNALKKYKFSDDDANITLDHLIDAHLTGHDFAGLPRLLVVLNAYRNDGAVPSEVKIIRETPVSALLDGGGNLGYVACWRAAQVAIEKARTSGVAVVGVSHAYYSGRSGYYTEAIAEAGLIAIHMSHAHPMVAPIGGQKPVIGTNPISIAVPSREGPLACDMSTAASTWGEVQLAANVGSTLPAGIAIDQFGTPTTDAKAALLGALLPWGGHKGYALGVMVQAFGILAGGDPVPGTHGSFGFTFMVFRPDLLQPLDEFESGLDELFVALRESGSAVRLPGEGSKRERKKHEALKEIEIPGEVVAAISAL